MAAIKIQLVKEKSERVAGVIRPLDQMRDALSWIVDWLPKMYDLAGEPLFEDSHWKVPEIWDEAAKSPNMTVLILEAEGRIQGYIVLKMRDHIGRDGKKCVYVSFVATAPWNRKRKNTHRVFSGVGKTLLWAGLVLGFVEYRSLCLELHSLPLAEGFYLKLGFRQTGYLSYEGLKEFRLEEAAAFPLIREVLASLTEAGGNKQ